MIRILSVIYLMIICQPVLGQMIADPYGKGNTESYGFILGLTEVEYEFNNHTNDVEVERTRRFYFRPQIPPSLVGLN